MVAGSRQLVNDLLVTNLIDEIRLMVRPIILGGGMRIFDAFDQIISCELAETRPF